MINAPIVKVEKIIDKTGANVKLDPPNVSSSNTPNTKPIKLIHIEVNTAIIIFFIKIIILNCFDLLVRFLFINDKYGNKYYCQYAYYK